MGADFFAKFDQRGIDVVLDERGGGGGASGGEVAAIDNDDIDALLGKMEGDERAGDAGADDQDLAANGAIHGLNGGRARGAVCVEQGPEGFSGVEVHSFLDVNFDFAGTEGVFNLAAGHLEFAAGQVLVPVAVFEADFFDEEFTGRGVVEIGDDDGDTADVIPSLVSE